MMLESNALNRDACGLFYVLQSHNPCLAKREFEGVKEKERK